MEEGGFTVVKRNKRSFKRKYNRNNSCMSNTEFELNEYSNTKQRIRKSEEKLFNHKFIKELDFLIEILAKNNKIPKDIVCYGIGQLSNTMNTAPTYQLAFVTYIQKKLNIERTYIYDPVLNPAENSILIDMGFRVIKENEQCYRKVEHNTLFIMFHMLDELYENLIQANINCMSYISIIGNNLHTLYQTKFELHKQHAIPYIESVLRFCSVFPIVNSLADKTIFDMAALHIYNV